MTSSHQPIPKDDKVCGLPDSTPPDRISGLPDSILCHVLSFLSTKQAATTSVLSKRWKPLWLSIFTLDFDDTAFKFSPSRVLSAMHSALHQRDIALPIHSFRFIYHQYSFCYQNDINLFIEFVRDRGVQNFTLNLIVPVCGPPSIELPRSILNCETLEVLKLKGIKIGDISHMQDLPLPKLKTLHLKDVLFECNQQLYNLLLRCPLLHDFESKHSINIEDNKNLHLLETYEALPNLIKAKLNDDLIRCPLSMLRNTIILCVDMSKRLCFFGNLVLLRSIPTFQRLTRLELNFKDIDWFDRCIWLLAILKHSPKLQNLIIKDTGVLEERNGICWKDPQIAPECLSSELKTFCFSGYRGTGWDFKFAKYIIENSKVLNTLTIHSKCSIGLFNWELSPLLLCFYNCFCGIFRVSCGMVIVHAKEGELPTMVLNRGFGCDCGHCCSYCGCFDADRGHCNPDTDADTIATIILQLHHVMRSAI
ncbi:FBD-associated F-box protein At4g10400-like [Vicia villosa]|uniref:FBD-associated F-box protein At4g10400-like n=1 Tax=Vicia villosa TaxID=3911 RepID=UPI00273CE832|nr:FBD-associated F-box protein At4g10400-like [Vicia villosa]